MKFEQAKFDALSNEIEEALAEASNTTDPVEHDKLTNWINDLFIELSNCSTVNREAIGAIIQ